MFQEQTPVQPNFLERMSDLFGIRIPLLRIHIGELITPVLWVLAYRKFKKSER
jgi:hypothetical protein